MCQTRTFATNGRLWRARARNWAEVQEGPCVAAYCAALAPFRQPDGSFSIAARFRCLVAAP